MSFTSFQCFKQYWEATHCNLKDLRAENAQDGPCCLHTLCSEVLCSSISLQNLDHAPLGRYLLQSKGAQIRDCTGWYPFTASIIHHYDMSFISFSKRHAIMGSLPAAIRRTSDQRLHRIVPLFLQASISALICPSLRFKDSRHTGELLAAI